LRIDWDFFAGMMVGQIAISLMFLAVRLGNDMPPGEAFNKFLLAVAFQTFFCWVMALFVKVFR
jgi:hypothetical protein